MNNDAKEAFLVQGREVLKQAITLNEQRTASFIEACEPVELVAQLVESNLARKLEVERSFFKEINLKAGREYLLTVNFKSENCKFIPYKLIQRINATNICGNQFAHIDIGSENELITKLIELLRNDNFVFFIKTWASK